MLERVGIAKATQVVMVYLLGMAIFQSGTCTKTIKSGIRSVQSQYFFNYKELQLLKTQSISLEKVCLKLNGPSIVTFYSKSLYYNN